jgi:hypothetical protein
MELGAYLRRRRLREPLLQREVLEFRGSEHLEHLYRLVANVLDEMSIILEHNPDVSSLIVERPRTSVRREDRHTGFTPEEEGPLVCIRVLWLLADPP